MLIFSASTSELVFHKFIYIFNKTVFSVIITTLFYDVVWLLERELKGRVAKLNLQ